MNFERKRPLLILDLDETLLYAAKQSLLHPPDLLVENYFVYIRPLLWQFLDTVEQHYELAIWTSSGRIYAEAIYNKLFPPGLPLAFLWSREHCSTAGDSGAANSQYVKDLNRLPALGYDLAHVLIVEDTPEKVQGHLQHLVQVTPYYGSQQDDELLYLGAFLARIHREPDLRAVERESWRKYKEI